MAFEILSDQQAADYERDGYVTVPDFLTADETETLLRTAEHDNGITTHATALKDSTGKASRLTLWHYPGDDIYGMIARSHKMVDSVEKLMGGLEAYHWHSKMMIKEPRIGGAWEWHQDYGYWYYDGCVYPDLLSVLIFVTPANRENGCLQVLRGSHQMGRIDHDSKGNQAGANLERVEQAKTRCEHVYCEAEPGTALFFHGNLLHASDPNVSDKPRWSLICCYNSKRNSPYFKRDHPEYTPLEKVPNDKILEYGEKTLSENVGYWAVGEEKQY